MSTEVNTAVVRRFWEDFNAHQLDGWNEGCTTSFIKHDLALPIPDADLPPLTLSLDALLAAFPDLTSSEDDLLAAGNKVVTRRTLRGTHRGALLGIAPTGKEVAFSSAWLAHFSNGNLKEQWVYVDMIGLLCQLGALPASASSGR